MGLEKELRNNLLPVCQPLKCVAWGQKVDFGTEKGYNRLLILDNFRESVDE